MRSLLAVAGYGALASASMVAGGLIAARWPPSARVRSYMQHVAAGFVFAAAAVEILPDVMHRGQPVAARIVPPDEDHCTGRLPTDTKTFELNYRGAKLAEKRFELVRSGEEAPSVSRRTPSLPH